MPKLQTTFSQITHLLIKNYVRLVAKIAEKSLVLRAGNKIKFGIFIKVSVNKCKQNVYIVYKTLNKDYMSGHVLLAFFTKIHSFFHRF